MKFLDIRRDEVAKVWITWTMVALISIGYAIGWSAVHSMLVKRLGVEYLPYTYIGISILGMIGSSIALSISDAPFMGPTGSVAVGMIDGKYILNPTLAEPRGSRWTQHLAFEP